MTGNVTKRRMAVQVYYQHLNDHWDLDHPYQRLLVDTAVTPSAAAVP